MTKHTKGAMVELDRKGFVPIKHHGKKGLYYGANQQWYDRFTMRFGGCGPIAIANIFAYKAMTEDKYSALAPKKTGGAYELDVFKVYCARIYESVRPIELYPFNQWSDDADAPVCLPTLGVPSPRVLIRGALRHAAHCGVTLSPVAYSGELDKSRISAFIVTALNDNQPIALLNRLQAVDMQYKLKGGDIRCASFERHWVTITGHYTHPRTGEVTLLVSTWGTRAAVSLDALIAKRRLANIFLPPSLIYFD